MTPYYHVPTPPDAQSDGAHFPECGCLPPYADCTHPPCDCWVCLEDEPQADALDTLPIARLLHARLTSWFGDDRQAFLVSDLVPVVTQIVAEFQYNAVEMARKAAIAEAERDAALTDNALLAAERDDLDTAVGALTAEVVEWREMAKRLLSGGAA